METRNNALWAHPELDFEELYREERFEDLIQTTVENVDLVMSHFRHANYAMLEKSIRMGNLQAAALTDVLHTAKERALIAVGKLIGSMEALERIQYENEQNRAAFARSKLLGTKHLDEVVRALSAHCSLSQTQLGELLDLQASTLSETLKKVRKTGLVQASPYGKYKMYSLTEEGQRYSEGLQRKSLYTPGAQPSQLDMDVAIKTLRLYLEDEETRGLCQKKLSDELDCAVVARGSCVSLHDLAKQQITKFEVEEIVNEGNDSEVSLHGTETQKIEYSFDLYINPQKRFWELIAVNG